MDTRQAYSAKHLKLDIVMTDLRNFYHFDYGLWAILLTTTPNLWSTILFVWPYEKIRYTFYCVFCVIGCSSDIIWAVLIISEMTLNQFLHYFYFKLKKKLKNYLQGESESPKVFIHENSAILGTFVDMSTFGDMGTEINISFKNEKCISGPKRRHNLKSFSV